MHQASPPTPPRTGTRGRGRRAAKRVIHEQQILEAVVPPGSRFKGYESFLVQDLILRAHTGAHRAVTGPLIACRLIRPRYQYPHTIELDISKAIRQPSHSATGA
jgi:hypothetical protein